MTKQLMKTIPVAVIQIAAHPKLQLYEILQRLGVTILVFVVMGANLRNVVEKTFKAKVFIRS